MKLTRDQIMAIGPELLRQVQSDAFGVAVDALHQSFVDRTFTTQPHEQEQREHYYYLNAALTELVSLMATLAHQAVEESKRIEAEQNPEDD